MRKTLRLIALTAGIISAFSAVILGCIYLEDMFGYMKQAKEKILAKLNDSTTELSASDYE